MSVDVNLRGRDGSQLIERSVIRKVYGPTDASRDKLTCETGSRIDFV